MDRLSKTIRRAHTHLQRRDRLILKILSSKSKLSRDFAALSYIYNELSFNRLLSQKWLTDLFRDDLSSYNQTQQLHIKRLHHHYIHHGLFSTKEIIDTTLAIARCESKWQDAKKNGNINNALLELEMLLEKQRQQNIAKMRHYGFASPYEAAMNEYDPGLSLERFDSLVDAIKPYCGFYDHPQEQAPDTSGLLSLDIETQKKLCEKILVHLGVNLQETTFVEGPHPACFGSKGDVLITMDYDEGNFLYAVISTIHEAGHALLRQHAPETLKDGPASEINSQSTDETFALLLENTLGKSEGLAHFLTKTLAELDALPAGLDAKMIYNHLNGSGFSLIRTKAELSNYSPHIILRYQIAKKLMDENTPTRDLPDLWHYYEQSLFTDSIARNDHRVLQDIHWYGGRIGYFPCYLTGMLASTQIYQHLCDKDPHLANSINVFDATPLITALQQGIYQNAYLYQSDDFVEKTTGQKLSADAFIQNYKHAKIENINDKKTCKKQGKQKKRRLF